MSNNNNIENLFKDKFSNFDLKAQPKGWDKIENTLNKNRSNFYKKITTASIATSIIVVALLYLVNKNEIKSDIVKDEISQQDKVELLDSNENNKNNKLIIKENTSSLKEIIKEIKEPNTINQLVINTPDTLAKNEKLDSKVEKQDEIKELILPSASFNIQTTKGCLPLIIDFVPEEISDTIIYTWNFGDGISSNEKKPTHKYKNAGKYTVSLSVKYYKTNNVIREVKKSVVTVYSKPKSEFIVSQKLAVFTFSSTSNKGETCKWLGLGNNTPTTNKVNYRFSKYGNHNITLITTSKFGCKDTVTKTVNNIEQSTFDIYMPNAFTPDGDGVNDIFGINKTVEVNTFSMQIFDLQGKILFASSDPLDGWNGKDKWGKPMANGKYIWKIVLTDKTNTIIKKSGYLSLIK